MRLTVRRFRRRQRRQTMRQLRALLAAQTSELATMRTLHERHADELRQVRLALVEIGADVSALVRRTPAPGSAGWRYQTVSTGALPAEEAAGGRTP